MYHFERNTASLPSRPFRAWRDTSCVTCGERIWVGELMAAYRQRATCMACAAGLW